MQKWLVFYFVTVVIVSALFCFKLNTTIQKEELRSHNLLNQMLDLTEDALRYVKPTEGDWKYFSDLGWAFMPTDGKNWAYWRDKQGEAQFFTLLDLALFKNQGNNVYLRPFQYRKAYAFNPVSIDRKELQKVDDIQNEYGRIWIEVQEPGRLVLTSLILPLKFRPPRKVYLKIENHYLVEHTEESNAFYNASVPSLAFFIPHLSRQPRLATRQTVLWLAGMNPPRRMNLYTLSDERCGDYFFKISEAIFSATSNWAKLLAFLLIVSS